MSLLSLTELQDSVRMLWGKVIRVFIQECKVVGFHMGDFPNARGNHKRQQYFIIHHEQINVISHIDFKEIGRTIFFSRQEAEKKLKERKGK